MTLRRAFEELDCCETELGELILRRRTVASLGVEIHEVKLGGEFLMSSLVNASEIALARLALARFGSSACDVLVGGLGLGHTAHEALQHPNVRTVTVVERLQPVLGWHRRGLVPLGQSLSRDERCELVHEDFFAWVAMRDGPRYGAILLDIDHAPESLLHESHAAFYRPEGLRQLRARLVPGGVFALWSSSPSPDFANDLRAVFAGVEECPVEFDNPLLGRDETNLIYIADDGAR